MIAYSLLGQRCIAPYSPSALSIFLNSTNYIKPPRTTHFVKFMIGDGLVNAEYEVHKRQRRILTPAFGVSHIRAITPHFWYKATQLAQHLSVEVDEQRKEGIDVMRWMNRVTLDIIGLAGTLPNLFLSLSELLPSFDMSPALLPYSDLFIQEGRLT